MRTFIVIVCLLAAGSVYASGPSVLNTPTPPVVVTPPVERCTLAECPPEIPQAPTFIE